MEAQLHGVRRTLFSWIAAARRLTGAGLAAGLVLLAPPALRAATLDPAVLPRVQAATFEVVIPKLAKDPLTYEKPLPLESFQKRNDKYNSVGTAFALDNQHYITAGHVLTLGIGSLTGEPALRDASGHVYAIDQITRFSLQQDFVEFTLKGSPRIAPLEVNTQPTMNDVVYAVGNALGTGIVIRDGLYTSQTPEDENGRWKWLRFSAAASPGNSGGPLLDKDGKIIGVVLMKSPGENLNYALPIGEVFKAPANLAVADQRQAYALNVIQDKGAGVLKMQFSLPRNFADFSTTFLKLRDKNDDQLLQKLLSANAGTLFPNGPGASRALHGGSDGDPFPGLLHRDDDGVWRVAKSRPAKRALPFNGSLAMAKWQWGDQVLFHLRKPDNVSSRQLYGDSKLFSDLLTKTGEIRRRIGSESIKITSLGSPTEEQTFTDAYRRNWQIKVWPLSYQNARIVVFLLPVPDGYSGMFRVMPPIAGHSQMANLKVMTNFIDLAYQGTLAQWQDYLTNTELLPAALKDITLRFDYGRAWVYRSPRLDFAYTPALQAIDQNSLLTLGLSYFQDRGKAVWDISSLVSRANANDASGASGVISIRRRIAPSGDLDDNYRSEWNKLLQRNHPYDGVPYDKNDVTVIATAGGAPVVAGAKPDLLYQISYAAEGPHPDDVMKDKLKLLLDKLHVNERWTPRPKSD